MAVAAMLEEIDRFCTDEKQLVTYQWLSRKLNVPSDTSKRLLAQYAQTKGDQVQPLFFVSGRAKGSGGPHSIKIVAGADVDATKEHFEQVSSVHVYSVQLKVPTDPTDLFQVDHASRKDEFEQPPGLANPLRDNRWSRVQFEFVRTERSVAPTIAPKAEAAPQPKVERSSGPAGARTGKQNKPSMFPPMAAKSSKPKVPARASEAPAPSQSKPLKKGQSGLASFFQKSAGKVPADPAKPKARTPAAASLDEVEDRDDEDEEDEDEDDAGQAVQKSKRSKSGQTKRRRVAYISSDSEDEEDEEASAREQAEAEERLRQREAAAEEEERQAASALQDSRKRPIYSEDEDEDEESEEEQDDAQDGQRQDTAEPAQTEDAQGGTDGKRVIRKKRSRTFMNDKGFITTEEFWEETEVDENGVEGETRVVDAPTESASAKPDSKMPAKPPAKKKSEAAAAETKPAPGETKPKKKSKKAAGTRDIMSFFGKKA